jgi:hypothetical protein
VDVERERVDGEPALERLQLLEGAVQPGLVEVVGDGHVRVVGEPRLDGQRSLAHGVGEHLAVGDAGDHVDEHHRRDGPEGPGAAQPGGERGPRGRHRLEVRVDQGQQDVVDVDRRQQGDVRRDLQRGRVTELDPVRLQVAAPGLGDRDGDPDGRHWTSPTRS